MHKDQKRILYLDGLRGLAAMGVLFHHLLHACVGRDNEWATLFGERYSFVPVTSGWVGVELFFMISGFVILLTLERCTGLIDFLIRRWLRLFPAILIATVLTLVFSHTIQTEPGFKDLPLRDAVPGLTLISPSVLHAALDIDFHSIESVYWTLYVEAFFYLVFGIMFFIAGWRWSVIALLVIHLATLYGKPAMVALIGPHPLTRAPEPFQWLGCHYYFWFAAGILFAKAQESKSERLFVLGCVVAILAAFSTRPNPSPLEWSTIFTMLFVALFFAAAQRFKWLQTALEWRPLLFLGFISYPLYLLHQNIGVGLIVQTQRRLPWLPTDLQWLPAIAIVILLAWVVAKFAEPRLRKSLLRLLCHIKIVRQTRSA